MANQPPALLDELRVLEELLLTQAVRSSRDRVDALLAPEFAEFGSSGKIYTRADILESLATEAPVSIRATDFRLTHASRDTALLTYSSVREVPGQPLKRALRSSLWVRRSKAWQMLFHQGTPVE